MEQWIKYASQLKYIAISVENRNINTDARYEVKENTLISKSLFENIGNKGAINLTNSSASLIVDLSIFFNCRNSENGAAIYTKLKGSSSFSLTKSCIDSCRNIGLISYSCSFCVNGETGSHIVHIEESTITNNQGRYNDGISIWRSDNIISFINESSCTTGTSYTGVNSDSGDFGIQKYNFYSNLTSNYIFNLGNKCNSIFRCIFKENDPQTNSLIRSFSDSSMFINSCVFEKFGNNLFKIENHASVKCFDCYFDQKISNQNSLSIFSNNDKFQNVFTFRSLGKCTIKKVSARYK